MQKQEGPLALIDVKSVDRFGATSSIALEQVGLCLTVGYDFEEFRAISAQARPDHEIGAPFCADTQNLGKGNAIWIVGRDETGETVHLQALRVLPTNATSLAEYFRHNFKLYAPGDVDIDFERSRYRPGPGAKRIFGTVVYSGEMWIGGEKGRFRGTHVSSLLARIMFMTALREFGADYVVGFMARPVAHKGFPMRMGYMHAEPQAVRLQVRGELNPMEGLMVYMSSEDIEFLLGLPGAEAEALVA